ncbi:MAG TPA: biotin--[acetyl-CoA-carboxylase] ligase [Pirellulales bacterium]|jgi:BirA family biotin operon repressor/biotin-[acetyl-CoA-carboxylase] ligase
MATPEAAPGLDPRKLEVELRGNRLIGRRIIVLPSVTSTNDTVFEMAKDGAEEGLVVFAEEQTAGRGQRGQRWESATGKGLWFSMLLFPDLCPAESPRLTDWAAHSVANCINQQLGLGATVKPPNDVYIAARKVAGILVEMRARPGQPHLAVSGIGLNVNQDESEFPPALRDKAGSLATAASRAIDRQSLACALLWRLDQDYAAAFG